MTFGNTKPRSDSDLLQRLKSGDQRAWAEYTQVYSARLYNYLHSNLPNAEDIEDVLSETMLAAVKALPTFDGQASLTTFTFALAQRKMADFWRKRQPTSELAETVSSASVDTGQLEFQEALNRLPEPSRQALLLRYQVGMGVPEIATVMNRSYKAIESLLSRAREQLREALEGVIGENG